MEGSCTQGFRAEERRMRGRKRGKDANVVTRYAYWEQLAFLCNCNMHTHTLFYITQTSCQQVLIGFCLPDRVCDMEKKHIIFSYIAYTFFQPSFICSPRMYSHATPNYMHTNMRASTAHTQFLYTKVFINSCSQFSIKSVWPGLVSKCYQNTPPYWLSWSPWQPLVRAFDWIWHICLPMSQIPRHQSTISL